MSIAIDKGIPPPDPSAPKAKRRRWPYAHMNVGDSIWVNNAESFRARASAYYMNGTTEMVFVSEARPHPDTGEPGVRIWRFE